MTNFRNPDIPDARQSDENMDLLLSSCKRALHDYHNEGSPQFRDKEALIGNFVNYVKVLERTVAQFYYWRPYLAREKGLRKWRRMLREQDIWGKPHENSNWA